MSIKPQFRPSMEAISYQGKTMLLNELTMAFQTLLEQEKIDELSFAKLGLENIVKRNTGLTIEFRLMSEGSPIDAFAVPPILDVNSPLLEMFKRVGMANSLAIHSEGHVKVINYSRDLRGQIDLDSGKVSGIFSKIPSSIAIGSGLWETVKLTPVETAAIVIHEVGHVFSYFETLIQTVTTNAVIGSAIQSLKSTEDKTIRLKLVFETAEALGVKLEDPDSLTDVKDGGEIFSAVLLKAMADKRTHSAAGSETYDLRSAEFMADQFTTRQGGGKDLAVALDKTLRFDRSSYGRSTSKHIAIEAVRVACLVLLAIAAPVWTGIIAGLMLVYADPEGRIYDDPGERLARIKNDLVQTLKDTSLPKKVRGQLLSDIETIDSVRQDIKDRRSFFNYIWLAVSSKRRDQFTQMRLQQELEKLVNNDLFIKASQLKTMA